MWEGYIDKTEHMPKSLFKFFPFNHNSLKCIENNSVFMNNPSNFNDPFDCLLCANENEFLKYCLLDYLKETDAIGRGILSRDELNKLEYSFAVIGNHIVEVYIILLIVLLLISVMILN